MTNLNYTNSINDCNWIYQYTASDLKWFNDASNVDLTNNSFLNNFSITDFLLSSNFHRNQFLLDSKSNLSLTDALTVLNIQNSNETAIFKFFNSIIWDIYNILNSITIDFLLFMNTNFGNSLTHLLKFNPELLLASRDCWYQWYAQNPLFSRIISFYKSYMLGVEQVNLMMDIMKLTLMFTLSTFIVIFLLSNTNSSVWKKLFNVILTRANFYLISKSVETRLQFEALLNSIVFFLLYFVLAVMTYDDDEEEVLGLFIDSYLIFFVLVVLYLVYKHSIHFLSFLGLAVKEGRTVSFITKQFFKDGLNLLSIIFRLGIVILRFEVYDGLDDFFDSYYIFLADFNEENYLDESVSVLYESTTFISDNQGDDDLRFDDATNTSFFNLSYLYTLNWDKLFFFFFLIVEEAARLSLAFYVFYLIVFEVYSVNASYFIDNYISTTKK